jgi:hypothetical protein
MAMAPASRLKEGVGKEKPDEELFFSALGAAIPGA